MHRLGFAIVALFAVVGIYFGSGLLRDRSRIARECERFVKLEWIEPTNIDGCKNDKKVRSKAKVAQEIQYLFRLRSTAEKGSRELETLHEFDETIPSLPIDVRISNSPLEGFPSRFKVKLVGITLTDPVSVDDEFSLSGTRLDNSENIFLSLAGIPRVGLADASQGCSLLSYVAATEGKCRAEVWIKVAKLSNDSSPILMVEALRLTPPSEEELANGLKNYVSKRFEEVQLSDEP